MGNSGVGVLAIDMEHAHITITPDDLRTIPAEELKTRSVIVSGEPCFIPSVIRKSLQSPVYATGILLPKNSPLAKQIRAVAGRLADLDVDMGELGQKEATDIFAVQNAAIGVYKAIERRIRLIIVPPYSFPRERGEGRTVDISKQFRCVTERPLYEDVVEEVLPAIVPILDDWQRVAGVYSSEECQTLVEYMSRDNRLGVDFAVAFGTAAGLDMSTFLESRLEDRSRLEVIIKRVRGIRKGKKLDSTDKYLAVAKIIEQGNRAKIPLQHVKYTRTFLYGIDFGSVIYQELIHTDHFVSDDELLKLFQKYGQLMTFCPLDAFKFQQPRVPKKENMFVDKEPEKVVRKICDFVYGHQANLEI